VSFLWGCSSDTPGDNPVVIPEEDPDEVVVTFSTGNSPTLSRAAFDEGTPVKVFVFRRSQSAPGSTNFLAAPYKIVEGTTSGTGALSSLTFTGGDITERDGSSEKMLTVRAGYTYDFIAVVNATSGATMANFGTLSSGVLTGFNHGSDILSGRKEGVIVNGQSTVDITFTEFGADAGNLPHLGSAVITEARATNDLITHLTKDGGSFRYAVAGMDFKQCLPQSANLPFASNPVAYTIQASGYTSSYSASILGTEVVVTSSSNVAISQNAILLPYPLRYSDKSYNSMTIDFRLRVNGGEVIFSAANIQVPAFNPGYRYRFIVELEHDPEVEEGIVNLYLSVEPWDSTTWQSGMGEGEDTESLMMVSLGSWSSVTWRSGMGGSSTNDMIIASVSGWSSTTWASYMGGE